MAKNSRRKRVWMHNSLFGGVAMSKGIMQRIIDSPTATDPAKRIAAEIITKLDDLAGFLKERKPDANS